jgi:hypothetical protein
VRPAMADMTFPGPTVPAPPTAEQMQASHAAVRARTVRTTAISAAVSLVAIAISLGTYLAAQSAADSGTDNAIGNRFFVLWGPALFFGWRTIQGVVHLTRLNAQARRLR